MSANQTVCSHHCLSPFFFFTKSGVDFKLWIIWICLRSLNVWFYCQFIAADESLKVFCTSEQPFIFSFIDPLELFFLWMDNSVTHSDTLILCLVASCERFLCFYFLCAYLTHLKRLVPEEKVTHFFWLNSWLGFMKEC